MTAQPVRGALRDDPTRRNNFDLTRLYLATMVYLGHYSWIFPNGPLPRSWLVFLIGPDGQVCVQGFFIISGFLMYQSFARSPRTIHFYEKRARRILPGYVTVILASAAGGAFLTTLPWQDYFSGKLVGYIFWNLTFLNFMHPTLPGVFQQPPTDYVNGPLWTLKVEVGYYALFPAIWWFGRRVGFTVCCCVLYILSAIYFVHLSGLGDRTGLNMYHTLAGQLPGQLRYFLVGGLIGSWMASVEKHRWTARIVAGIGSIGLLLPHIALISPILLACAVLGFCLLCPKLTNISKYGDLSFGIYICHFPVLQTMKATHLLAGNQTMLFVMSTAIILASSYLIWRFVERPMLKGRGISLGTVFPISLLAGTTATLSLSPMAILSRKPQRTADRERDRVE